MKSNYLRKRSGPNDAKKKAIAKSKKAKRKVV
jgi:hypothetical protein